MGEIATKQCIACKEDIHIDATKCRYCKQIQTTAANLQNKPIFSYMALIFIGLILIWMLYATVSFMIKDPLEPAFEVGPTELLLTETETDFNVRCIAQISNPTPKRWDSFSLQAVFKNASGEAIDVLYAKPDITIYPLFSFQAMVGGSGSALPGDYKSCELSVVNADDSNNQ